MDAPPPAPKQVRVELGSLKSSLSRVENTPSLLSGLSQDVSAVEEALAAQQRNMAALAENVNRALQSTAEASRVLSGYPPLSLYSSLVAPSARTAKPAALSRANAHLDVNLARMEDFAADMRTGGLSRSNSPGRARQY